MIVQLLWAAGKLALVTPSVMLNDELAVLGWFYDLRVWVVNREGGGDEEALVFAKSVIVIEVVFYDGAHDIDIFLQLPSIKLSVEED